jgi:serine/threonine protein kinase
MIFSQLVKGVGYLHSKGIVHLDLKLDNILIDLSNVVKIVDFGFSRSLVEPDQLLELICGTPYYMGPELLSKKHYLGQPADVWALGVILYVLLQKELPFKGNSVRDLFR